MPVFLLTQTERWFGRQFAALVGLCRKEYQPGRGRGDSYDLYKAN